MKIICPFDGAVFPPDLGTTQFRWDDATDGAECWRIRFDFSDGGKPLAFETETCEWSPPDAVWSEIKKRSLETDATVTIQGFRRLDPTQPLSEGQIVIRTSKDEVGAPIFYREVNLPFLEAVRDPAAHIRWRFGPVSCKEQPPIVLQKLPLCGNCHSFSNDGTVLGMDVDYGSDKGSYVICPVSQEMVLDNEKLITWSDYKREDNRGTLGLLSRVSPDGRYVISTVKDRSVFAPVDNLAFSQLFFPIQGILAYYDRQTRTFHALPGADDEQYVQSNAVWSPDGKYIVFARAKAYHSPAFRKKRRGFSRPDVVAQFLNGKRTFKYDLYRVPFNGGRGGKAVPLQGASNNGMSNYFPKYSPDGKWIVFCRAKSFMLLQPDSELFIIPANGGEARRLECNTGRMNSWHSWSPNGKWLVFSSKIYSPYTQLFLTHIDEEGHATPPVVLAHFTSENMAANIPEFVNAAPNAIQAIRPEFVSDRSYVQTGRWNFHDGDFELAICAFRKALEINPSNIEARVNLGAALLAVGRVDEAERELLRVLTHVPDNAEALWFRGKIFEKRGDVSRALQTYRRALEIDPQHAGAHQSIGRLLLQTGAVSEGRKYLLEAARLDKETTSPYLILASSFLREQEFEQAESLYRMALERDAECERALVGLATVLLQDEQSGREELQEAVELAEEACKVSGQRNAAALIVLADAYASVGRMSDAAAVARKALRVTRETKDTALDAAADALLERFQNQTLGQPPH
ncbi:MAG: tetratricopeptide repeat protein [Planctomycetes bacterium]|nr:tetratricopeptide repeat protein [Planctomycetota bacterium]